VGDKSGIEWTDTTWNPLTGCAKVSPGCAHCYAERMAARLRAMGQPRYRNGFALTLHEDQMSAPLRWRRPRRIFVNSMSDLFHEDVPIEYIRRVFSVMAEAHWHVFQVLTKRSARLAETAPLLDWPPNVWQGVSVENRRFAFRADHLRAVPAAVRFLSCEPLLGPLTALDVAGIDWVIAGGESGPGHRPVRAEWLADLRDRCASAGVPFFFKQWGGARPKSGGRELDGRTWDEWPVPQLRNSPPARSSG
jgi:protein gp37